MNYENTPSTYFFDYDGMRVSLIYELESTARGLQLVLLDVIGGSIRHVISVPDAAIEAAACAAAADRKARYS